MKIAVCQFQILFEQKQKNYVRAEKYVREAAGKEADIILFPEMSFTGFSMNTELTGETGHGLETVRLISELAKQMGIAVGFGWVKRRFKENILNENMLKSDTMKPDIIEKDRTAQSENHYTIIDQYGEILNDYVKIHPFSYSGEDIYFSAGDKAETFFYEGICFGTSICYDLRFPELYQELSKKAHMILVPANWPDTRSVHWKTLLRARAIENQVYIIGINCYGTQGHQYYSGGSSVINPNGEILLEINDTEDMQIIDITDDVDEYREKFPVKKDRRNSLYGKFYV